MKAIIKQVDGITFIGRADSNHWINIDGPENFHGSNAGCRPKEMLLIALGGCTGSDVVSILSKKRISLDHLEIRLDGDIVDEHPKVFSKIHIEYLFYGTDLTKKDLERAIDLSQNKYCPISAMLQKSCEITYSYEIISSKD